MADFVDYNPMMHMPPQCRFFMSPQGCRYGLRCRFMHDAAGGGSMGPSHMMSGAQAMMQGPVMVTPNPSYMPAAPGYVPRDSRGIPCRFFNSRGCRNGDRCPYMHVSDGRVSSKQYSEMTEQQKNDDKSRRIRQKLPALQVMRCGVCPTDVMRRPDGDRDIREALMDHYEKMFYAQDQAHIRYMKQDRFKVGEGDHVTCPATACEDSFAEVLSLIQHLCERCDMTKQTIGDPITFRHQYCLDGIARHFAWRDTLTYLRIDEFDSDEDIQRTLDNFNQELATLLNLAAATDNVTPITTNTAASNATTDSIVTSQNDMHHNDAIDQEIEDAIEKEMTKEMLKMQLTEEHGAEQAAELMAHYEQEEIQAAKNHGFDDNDVLALAAQGIKPDDPEAFEALQTLKENGEHF